MTKITASDAQARDIFGKLLRAIGPQDDTPTKLRKRMAQLECDLAEIRVGLEGLG